MLSAEGQHRAVQRGSDLGLPREDAAGNRESDYGDYWWNGDDEDEDNARGVGQGAENSHTQDIRHNQQTSSTSGERDETGSYVKQLANHFDVGSKSHEGKGRNIGSLVDEFLGAMEAGAHDFDDGTISRSASVAEEPDAKGVTAGASIGRDTLMPPSPRPVSTAFDTAALVNSLCTEFRSIIRQEESRQKPAPTLHPDTIRDIIREELAINAQPPLFDPEEMRDLIREEVRLIAQREFRAVLQEELNRKAKESAEGDGAKGTAEREALTALIRAEVQSTVQSTVHSELDIFFERLSKQKEPPVSSLPQKPTTAPAARATPPPLSTIPPTPPKQPLPIPSPTTSSHSGTSIVTNAMNPSTMPPSYGSNTSSKPPPSVDFVPPPTMSAPSASPVQLAHLLQTSKPNSPNLGPTAPPRMDPRHQPQSPYHPPMGSGAPSHPPMGPGQGQMSNGMYAPQYQDQYDDQYHDQPYAPPPPMHQHHQQQQQYRQQQQQYQQQQGYGQGRSSEEGQQGPNGPPPQRRKSLAPPNSIPTRRKSLAPEGALPSFGKNIQSRIGNTVYKI
ncbi:hypothetical protein HDV00_010527 [Rhizophlyctis rosea]|nr:hypothetical protein HDV00_010527 [Rhizophlyctis rosea]